MSQMDLALLTLHTPVASRFLTQPVSRPLPQALQTVLPGRVRGLRLTVKVVRNLSLPLLQPAPMKLWDNCGHLGG